MFEKYLYYSSWFSLPCSSSCWVFLAASLLSPLSISHGLSPFGPILSTGHVQCIMFFPCSELFQVTLTALPLISVIKHFSSTKTYKEISLLRYESKSSLLYCYFSWFYLRGTLIITYKIRYHCTNSVFLFQFSKCSRRALLDSFQSSRRGFSLWHKRCMLLFDMECD